MLLYCTCPLLLHCQEMHFYNARMLPLIPVLCHDKHVMLLYYTCPLQLCQEMDFYNASTLLLLKMVMTSIVTDKAQPCS